MVGGHTRGPWAISRAWNDDWSVDGPTPCSSIQIAAKGKRTPVAIVVSRGLGNHPLDANARLIAAAPDLLEALKLYYDACDLLGDGPDDSDVQHALRMIQTAHGKARAAISRATEGE